MAGVAGLEPANAGVKVPCLTTWRYPNMETPIGFEPMILGLQPRALPLGYGIIWWQQQDSNLRLTAYEAVLEPSPVILPFVIWCGEGESNPHTSRYQDLSLMRLPITPSPHMRVLVPMVGVEPTRYCYQRILSPPRLPIPPHRHIYGTLFFCLIN